MRQRSTVLCLSEVRLVPLGSRHRRLLLAAFSTPKPLLFSPHLPFHQSSSIFEQFIARNSQFVSKRSHQIPPKWSKQVCYIATCIEPLLSYCFLSDGLGGEGSR